MKSTKCVVADGCRIDRRDDELWIVYLWPYGPGSVELRNERVVNIYVMVNFVPDTLMKYWTSMSSPPVEDAAYGTRGYGEVNKARGLPRTKISHGLVSDIRFHTNIPLIKVISRSA